MNATMIAAARSPFDIATTQQQAARLLIEVLGTPGLAEASWDINRFARLEGYLYYDDADGARNRARIREYAKAFGLRVSEYPVGGEKPYICVRSVGVCRGVWMQVWVPVFEAQPVTATGVPAGPMEVTAA